MTADRRRLHGHVHALAGDIGERNIWQFSALQRAAGYIEDAFAACGYQPARKCFDVSQVPVCNIEAILPGTTHGGDIVVLGAHYDTVPHCPGANDNATGVAALLDLAHRFARRPRARTVRFVAFVNEEPPFFQTDRMGSLVYARSAQSHGDRIVAMVSLETMGYYSEAAGSQRYPLPMAPLYPSTGNFIGFVSNLASARLLLRARRAFKQRTRFPLQVAALPEAVPGVGWSDHWSFWQAGYPALMVTDTAPFRYPWYHTADDTPDKVCYEPFAEVVHGLEHVTSVLAG
jgi:Zn-dependent M28 family amino/carboxypeptidase